MSNEKGRGSFTGSMGFVMAAAGSAVGLGNIWRFPYLAAKDGGGVFLFCYVILAITFGFALLSTEIAIGRKTQQSPLTAYGMLHKKWKGLGVLASVVPAIILPYYCAIGGWVLKYLYTYVTGNAESAVADGYFTGFITQVEAPLIWMFIFLAVTIGITVAGVEKGIEKCSRILMPILFVLIICIAVFALTLSYTDGSGATRTGLQGLKYYVVPDFTGITFGKLLSTIMDALGQLFFSISVSMGIMVAYGSYARKDTNLMQSVNRIEIFDTLVAFLAGVMIIPAVFTFTGLEGMNAGPSLMFISLPKVFHAMGGVGLVIGILFFVLVTFAAVTSSVSIAEAITSGIIDKFGVSRKKGTILVGLYALVVGAIVCLGYNVFYFEYTLPNGAVAQVLDILDYISNNLFMPLVALLTCVLIGWVVKPKTIIDEITLGGYKFHREKLYIAMVKFVAPVLLVVLLLQSFGLFK